MDPARLSRDAGDDRVYVGGLERARALEEYSWGCISPSPGRARAVLLPVRPTGEL